MTKYPQIYKLIEEIETYLKKDEYLDEKRWNRLVRKYRKEDNSIPSKSFIIEYIKKEGIQVDKMVQSAMRMKPTRTISGVAPITIFTKPYRCSGRCIFCPTSTNTPKSYLSEEPGVQRAELLNYDPYKQVTMRIKALENIGHNANKVELIISGGTWDDYELNYRFWYIIEIFRALNNVPSKEFDEKHDYYNDKEYLFTLQNQNATGEKKNVGLTIETRPDKINLEAIKLYRIFGVTKVQVGVQMLNDEILKANQRDHTKEEIFNSINLLRSSGFKIHIHWMCNLYKSTKEIDYKDFIELFKNENVKPDEIKIYPCSIVKGTGIYELYKQGKYIPYTTEELIDLLSLCKKEIPEYCRVNRLFRDIPSNLIVDGNKYTNLRQKVLVNMNQKGWNCNCIRCRETKDAVKPDLRLKQIKYKTKETTEYFLQYVTKDNNLAGFLRLSIQDNPLIDVKAMIREIHIYGTSVKWEERSESSNQHTGLGSQLILEAEKIAKKHKIYTMGVIAAVGTREYYKKRGFEIEPNYGYGIKILSK